MKKKLIILSGFVLGSMPLIALAQTGIPPTSCAAVASTNGLSDLLCRVSNLLNSVLPVIVAIGVLYFVWGVVSYVIASEEEAKKAGRDRIIYGIIGLAVIIGMWGLVNLVRNSFGLTNTTTIILPTVPY